MITDRATAFIITLGDLGEEPRFSHEEPSLTPAGWDTLTQTYHCMRADLTAEDCAELFPIGARLGFRTWWICWAASKPLAVVVGSNAEQQSGERMRFPRFPGDETGQIFPKVQTHENSPTIRVSYLVEDIEAEGITSLVGTAVTPPVEVAVPASVWVYLNNYVYHWPNGWALMESAQDRLPGTSAALVNDSYRYIRQITPG
jgi:hypothetical protein